jgi:hypothetical protein
MALGRDDDSGLWVIDDGLTVTSAGYVFVTAGKMLEMF